MDATNVLVAFALTAIAGLSTGIGSLMALLAKRTSKRFLSVALGFSAGVMIYVSMIEIFPEARMSIAHELGEYAGTWITIASFFAGMILIALIDKHVPDVENPHEPRQLETIPDFHTISESKRLMKTGLLTVFVIMLHNFPEGMATFAAALKSPQLGVAIAVAIAIHNIPEGIAASFPIYYATDNKKKAFGLSFLSGLSEPLGALIGYIILFRYMNDIVFGILFGLIAGIMVFISLDELLPTAREYGEPHLSIYGMIGGMMLMAVSLVLFIS
ncbi:MAG TPA: zinc transporter ZupT [Clostridia bacterium]|nr:zinc transporter ZupT [Clostridia bacterium]